MARHQPMDEHANDDLYFGDTKLEHVSVYKYLGIQMNAWLTWTDHLGYVRKKVEKRWAALGKWFCHPLSAFVRARASPHTSYGKL